MADTPQLPLTVDAAKQRLRGAAAAMSMGEYVKRHPYRTLGAAFLAGILLADERRARTLLLAATLLKKGDGGNIF